MANQDILINWAPQETRVAVVENGAVQELHIERTLERGLVGNVYLGKVVRVLPGMQSAFIDIGMERAAFLHVADLNGHQGHANGAGRNDTPLPPIERQVFEGQTLTVQVVKDAIGTKGARLSAQISIAGRMLVFLPQDRRGWSRRGRWAGWCYPRLHRWSSRRRRAEWYFAGRHQWSRPRRWSEWC